MSGCDGNPLRSWYVLHYIRNLGVPSPRKFIDEFNKNGHCLELFAPIIRPAEIIGGKVVFKEKLLTYFYVFVRGVQEEIKELCARADNNLSMMLNRGGPQRYATIRDSDMENFRKIALAHVNTIPFFNIEDIDLERGDKVEVVDGIFAGLTGIFMPKTRSSKGNIVIAASPAQGAIVWDIDAKYVKILEFAKDSRRPYDIIEAFIPRLFPILRKHYHDMPLTEQEKSKLIVFNRRMHAVTLANPKLEAKLLAILMAVQKILGDEAGFRSLKAKFETCQSSITNPWTQALSSLLLAAVEKKADMLREEYEKIKEGRPELSAFNSLLLAEYEFYRREESASGTSD